MSCCTPTWRGTALVRTDSDSGLTSRLLHGRQAAASNCDVSALEGLCYLRLYTKAVSTTCSVQHTHSCRTAQWQHTIPFVVCSLYCFGCSAGTARALHRRALGAGGDPRAVPPHVLCARRSAGIARCGQSGETNKQCNTRAGPRWACATVHSLWTRLSTLSEYLAGTAACARPHRAVLWSVCAQSQAL